MIFENSVLRRIFGSKKEEGARGWRRLHNEEFRNSNTSQFIIRVIKSKVMRWAGHVAHMGEIINAYNVGKYGGKLWS
jgi:hypothetical protein